MLRPGNTLGLVTVSSALVRPQDRGERVSVVKVVGDDPYVRVHGVDLDR